MTVRVGINGFGRIGRNFLRAILATGADVEVVGVNDLTSAETLAHLLRYDSTHGRLPVPVDVEGSDLVVGEQHIRVLAEREPEQLPWDALGVDVVIESTGRFTSRADAAGHLGGSVKRVIISGPSGDADAHLRHRRQRRRRSTRHATSWSRTPRAPRTASCRWSRWSTTPSTS